MQTDWLKFIKYFPSWSCRATDRVETFKNKFCLEEISYYGNRNNMEREESRQPTLSELFANDTFSFT